MFLPAVCLIYSFEDVNVSIFCPVFWQHGGLDWPWEIKDRPQEWSDSLSLWLPERDTYEESGPGPHPRFRNTHKVTRCGLFGMFAVVCVLFSRTGVGDFQVTDITFLPDPCPLPDAQKKRALNEKERLLYAPLAGVGGLVYDKDAVYIDLPANHIHQQVLSIYLRHMPTFWMTVLYDLYILFSSTLFPFISV